MSARIINGAAASSQQFTFAATLLDISLGASLRVQHFCGGTLIAPSYMVTAAHCINVGKLSNYRVGMYRHDLTLSDGEEHACANSNIMIDSVAIHPDYTRETLDSDLAVVKLAAPFYCSDLVYATIDTTGDLATIDATTDRCIPSYKSNACVA